MTFGAPTRYMQFSPSRVKALNWDRAVRDANEEYRKRMHNLFCDNCHSHVAYEPLCFFRFKCSPLTAVVSSPQIRP